ncbi:Glycosyl hydrolases family 43 [Salegentibacter agarivorans]|uniref:Glycosyl hydrolases family 43 n=1 Tax=Salegentibacter agarivorans TaxID=345907 RepID=A0A1I2KV86_9FLAO|nr:glycoside hydrolase family 43 protein [Salegentibacter agarivorans]SFF70249.1 Glycosyl hydrolases family 43 [Salegentibacter agarivorans]
MKLKIKMLALVGLGVMLAPQLTKAQNPIITDVFTADPAPLVYDDTVYLYTSHDTASVSSTNYEMKDWLVFSSTDMKNWKNHGPKLSPKDFSWATGDAYAAEVAERDGKFYFYVSTFHKDDDRSNGGAAIGVAVADSPLGPFKDAKGEALIYNEMTTDNPHGWDDIDPSVFVDDDGQAYMYWGNGSLKMVKLKDNMIELDGEIHYYNPKNFIEGPWVYKRKGLYYLVYASKGEERERVEYATSDSPEGPWEYRGILADSAPNSFTIHPGIIEYKGKDYFFYHNGVLPTGGSYRRSITVDYMYYNEDGTIKKVEQTEEGVKAVE